MQTPTLDQPQDAEDGPDPLVARNASLALTLNWMRRQVDLLRSEDDLPLDLLGPEIRRERLQAQIEAQAREIRALTERLETRDAPAYALAEEIAADRDALRSYAAELERRHIETLHSTSWRSGAPLRWVLRRLRGLRAPEPFEPRYWGRSD